MGFLGYGNPAGSVWFVGIGEGLGQAASKDAVENLTARGVFEKIMDLRDAHHIRLNGKNGQLIDFDERPPSTQVWKWTAKIMCASCGQDWGNPSVVKEYVRCYLGRSEEDTFLTELSPIPSRHTGEDKIWREMIKTRCAELGLRFEELLDKRKKALLELLQKKRPRLVICYGDGKKRTCEFAKFFSIEWTSLTAEIKSASINSCPFLLLPFFGRGYMKPSVLEEIFRLNLIPHRST
jgi:hypothetical protein